MFICMLDKDSDLRSKDLLKDQAEWEKLSNVIFSLLGEYANKAHTLSDVHDHLMGTFVILENQGAPTRLKVAGALHNIYETNAFSFSTNFKVEREVARKLIGNEAEHLVYLFSDLDWAKFLDLSGDLESTDFSDYFRSYSQLVSRSIFTEIVTLFFANILEQWNSIPNGKKVFFRRRLARFNDFIQEDSFIYSSIFKE